MDKAEVQRALRNVWHFIWEEESILSWMANVILAFLLIYFIVYPVLGFLLGTSFPIVAVISGSMEHDEKFELWWTDNRDWYEKNNISMGDFSSFPFTNGFNKGDIMVLRWREPENIQVGDILVFKGGKPSPIIHRVVKKWQDDGLLFKTKGDFNRDSIAQGFVDEREIKTDRVLGVAVFRIPLLGWIKIWFVDYIGMPYCRITGDIWPCRRI